MIIYNVTVKIDPNVEEDWLDWMREIHIPDVMNTGLFVDSTLRRLLLQEEDGGHTFSIQYRVENMEKLEEYQSKYATQLQKEHADRYQGNYVAFRTLMKEECTF